MRSGVAYVNIICDTRRPPSEASVTIDSATEGGIDEWPLPNRGYPESRNEACNSDWWDINLMVPSTCGSPDPKQKRAVGKYSWSVLELQYYLQKLTSEELKTGISRVLSYSLRAHMEVLS